MFLFIKATIVCLADRRPEKRKENPGCTVNFIVLCELTINVSWKDRNRLKGIVTMCSKTIGVQQRDLASLWESHVVRKAARMIDWNQKPNLSSNCTLMPSGQRYHKHLTKTNRYTSFFLQSNNWTLIRFILELLSIDLYSWFCLLS